MVCWLAHRRWWLTGCSVYSNELCSMGHHKHTQVWPRSVARPTWNPTLVGCTRACHIQAMLVCLQVSAWNGSAISVADVIVDLVVAWPSSSAFCCPWTTCRSSLQTYNSWQKGILFHWPVSLEQSPNGPTYLNDHTSIWTLLNVSLNHFCFRRTDTAFSALEISSK